MTEINKINTNPKPIETVYEIKEDYKVPSFEEFMKSYESDSKVNYADLNSSDIGEVKGYGPTIEGTNTQKWCGKCSSYKNVGVNAVYCPDCSTSFGTVSTTTTIDKQIKEGVQNVKNYGGTFEYSVERKTGADGSYSEKESAKWSK